MEKLVILADMTFKLIRSASPCMEMKILMGLGLPWGVLCGRTKVCGYGELIRGVGAHQKCSPKMFTVSGLVSMGKLCNFGVMRLGVA